MNLTASRDSLLGILQFPEMRVHLFVKHLMAKSLGMFVNRDITSSEIKQKPLSIFLSLNKLTNSKLLLIWPFALGRFLIIIPCREVASEYKRLSIDDIIILKRQLGLCTFERS